MQLVIFWCCWLFAEIAYGQFKENEDLFCESSRVRDCMGAEILKHKDCVWLCSLLTLTFLPWTSIYYVQKTMNSSTEVMSLTASLLMIDSFFYLIYYFKF